jgi:hypothetical protein
MTTTTTIPVSITPEATARIATLGMQREFDEMLEHTRRTIDHLHAIDVGLEEKPDDEDDPTIVITPLRVGSISADDRADWNWMEWFVRTYPPEVIRHFTISSSYE